MSDVTLHCGDCLDILKTLDANSVDACVTDPPYGLAFMGKHWDHGVPGVAFWREVIRVLKPGAHIVAFGGTKTYHRLAGAIEGAGFEIRDMISWLYGSGFPKSRNIGEGRGTALKPACEPCVLARKPLIGTVASNVEQYGTGALNIDGCRVATDEGLNGGAYRDGEASADRTYADKGGTNFAMKPGMRRGRSPMNGDERSGAALGMFQDGKTVGAEFKQPPGRWPANVIHDGSDEVVGQFPETSSGASCVSRASGADRDGNTGSAYGKESRPAGTPMVAHGDSGSAARFFYTAKADADDRLGSKHPTVKPLDLMQYLVRLVTPPKGLVLDPFAGTGTTGEAAIREGMRAILIEREEEYQDDIRKRMSLVRSSKAERKRVSLQRRGRLEEKKGTLL